MPYGDCTGPDGMGPVWARGGYGYPTTPVTYNTPYYGLRRWAPYYGWGYALGRGIGRFFGGFMGYGRGFGMGRRGGWGRGGYGRGRGFGMGRRGGWGRGGYGRGRGWGW